MKTDMELQAAMNKLVVDAEKAVVPAFRPTPLWLLGNGKVDVCEECCGSGIKGNFAEHEYTCRSCMGTGRKA